MLKFHCQECGKMIEPGDKDSPETWKKVVNLRTDIPMSASPIGIELKFCSHACLAIYLIRTEMKS